MSNEAQAITKKRVVFRLPNEDAVTIRRDVAYRQSETGALTLDIYYPPDFSSGSRVPAVIFVSGYSDPGFQKMLGCKLKEMESYISWGKLTATSDLVAITYSAVDPVADTGALLDFVRQNATHLGIDHERIGIWACSGNAPNALSILMKQAPDHLKFAVLLYPYLLDIDGYTGTAESAKLFGFVNPCEGQSIEDLQSHTPLFIIRAGCDAMPRLNETMDRFLSRALSSNFPIRFTNHPTAPHGFDILDDSKATHEIIDSILAFMRFQLLGH